MPRGEIIGIVIGGVVIFALISMIPLCVSPHGLGYAPPLHANTLQVLSC
jgi:hypothetical protein